MSTAPKRTPEDAAKLEDLRTLLQAHEDPGFNLLVADPGADPPPALFLFVEEDDAEHYRAQGVEADVFNTGRDATGLDVLIIAPKSHLYADEQAHHVADVMYRRGAMDVRIVQPPIKREFVKIRDSGWTADLLRAEADITRSWEPAQSGAVGARPEIEITTDEMSVNDQVINALARDPDLYVNGDVLVTILDVGVAPKGVDYQGDPPPQVRPVSGHTLRERIASRVRFVKAVPKGDGVVDVHKAHPPAWCVSAVLARGVYRGMRQLVGVVQAPTMRPDGSILDQPGYDPPTRLYYKPDRQFEKVPVQPTFQDAEAARDVLLELVCDFPFRSRLDLAVWLVALLTVLARSSFRGPTPLFGFDGNTPGSGKTLLADIIARLANSRPMPKGSFPSGRGSDEELRKRITSLALAGERFTLFDNVADPLGGASLDAALTATTWKDRILGASTMTKELPLNLTMFATGNNLQGTGDILRRVLFSRLESPLERPEERQGFKHPNLVAHLEANRGRLVPAALTILRAYRVAGRPAPLPALGSFEGWTQAIVEPVAWTMGVNPLDVRKNIRTADQGAVLRNAMVEGWAELPGSEGGLTVAEALKILGARDAGDQFEVLRSALMELSNNSDLPSARSIGKHLTAIQGRVVGSFTLKGSATRTRAMAWRVERVAQPTPGPSAEFAEFENPVQSLNIDQTRHLNPSQDNGLSGHAEFAEFESVYPAREETRKQNPDGLQTDSANSANSAAEREVFEL